MYNQATTALVEPDVRISRIRLTRALHRRRARGRSSEMSLTKSRIGRAVAPLAPPPLRFSLGLLVQPPPQRVDFLWLSAPRIRFQRDVRQQGQLFRSGVFCSSGPPFLSRLHAPGRAPWLHGNYPASRLLSAPPTPGGTATALMVSRRALGSTRTAGSPRFLGQSFGARWPQSPRQARWLHPSVASPAYQASTNPEAWPPGSCVSRPNRVRLRYGSRLRFGRLRRPGRPGRRSVGRVVLAPLRRLDV